jgi:hypothetical protein
VHDAASRALWGKPATEAGDCSNWAASRCAYEAVWSAGLGAVAVSQEPLTWPLELPAWSKVADLILCESQHACNRRQPIITAWRQVAFFNAGERRGRLSIFGEVSQRVYSRSLTLPGVKEPLSQAKVPIRLSPMPPRRRVVFIFTYFRSKRFVVLTSRPFVSRTSVSLHASRH